MSQWRRLVERTTRITVRRTGEPVEYHCQGGPVLALVVTVWRSYFAMDEANIPVQQHQPKLGVDLSDFPLGVMPRQGDRVFIGADAFVVSGVQSDPAYGSADIFLHREP